MKITNKTHLLMFDVDETIAASGESVSENFTKLLLKLKKAGYSIVFATSRSYSELEKRVDKRILLDAYSFTCMGMEMWHNGIMNYQHNFDWPKGLKRTLSAIIDACNCPHKTGNHIFQRPSMGAFSVLGAGATKQEREKFIAWNKKTNYLNDTCDYLNDHFLSVNFAVYGKTTIDFSDKVMSKAIILPELRKITDKCVVFFGDNMQQGGNDFELAEALRLESQENITVLVGNTQDTYDFLICKVLHKA